MRVALRRAVRPLPALVGALLVLPCLSLEARAAEDAKPAAKAAAPAPAPVPAAPAGVPQPPGPAPEGKVWSPEHGHWHDIPGAMPGAPTPLTLTPVAGGLPQAGHAGHAGALIPQPEGPVPDGKYWSPEHGHWHDIPGAMSTTAAPLQLMPVDGGAPVPMTPGQPPGLVPQPEGPVPPGKVWSPEHGHWHDIPGAMSATASPLQLMPVDGGAPVPMTPGQPPALVPQPEGPVPPGKVWSPEHGHWHDAPPVTTTTTPAPVTVTPVPVPPAAPLKNP